MAQSQDLPEETRPSTWAQRAIAAIDQRSLGPPMDRSLRVTINFHPDRHTADGRLMIAALADEGVYRTQFETGTSGGGLTAHPGGDRWRWEARLFGGAYNDAPYAERPKYGALDHRRRALGGAPRFGSAFLRLTDEVLDRTTFCFPDSFLEPDLFGTAHRCELMSHADRAHSELLAGSTPGQGRHEPEDGDLLDGYVEAHVHGVLEIGRDAEAVVLDPCYRHTAVADHALRLGVPVEWHEGRVLDVDTLQRNANYRDPDAVAVGLSLAHDGLIHAGLIGDAAREGAHHPQSIKQVWHHTAHFGAPAR